MNGDRVMESLMENSSRTLYGVNRIIKRLVNVGGKH